MMPGDKVNITREQLRDLLSRHMVDFCEKEEVVDSEEKLRDFLFNFLSDAEDQSLQNDAGEEQLRRTRVAKILGGEKKEDSLHESKS